MQRSCKIDWTRDPTSESLTPFQRLVHNVDWAQTPLGPMCKWDLQVRQIFLIVAADPHPAVLLWGKETTVLYNEAFAGVIGPNHPNAYGKSGEAAFPESWGWIGQFVEQTVTTGQPSVEIDQLLMVTRDGYLQERYLNWKFLPIVGEEGFPIGVLGNVMESTDEVLTSRRKRSVYDMRDRLAGAVSLAEVFGHVLDGLRNHNKDTPVTLLYSVRNRAGDTQRVPPFRPLVCHLEGATGLPSQHPPLSSEFALNDKSNSLASALREATKVQGQLQLRSEDDHFPELFASEGHWPVFDTPCTSVLICPLRTGLSEDPFAFVVIGLNPRRPYDSDYQNYMRLLLGQITSPHLTSIVQADSLISALYNGRGNEDRDVSNMLQARMLEQSEMKFFRFADRAPIGISLVDPEGMTIYANDMFWVIMGIEKKHVAPLAWKEAVIDADRAMVEEKWVRLVERKEVVRYTVRFKRPWRGKDDAHTSGYSTALALGFPDVDEDGKVKTITSILMDFSELRWTHEQLKLRTQELERSESSYREFASMAPLGVGRIDPEGKIVYANDAWYSIIGQPVDTGAMGWLATVHPDDKERVLSYYKALRASKGSRTIEAKLLADRGEGYKRTVWITVSAYSQRDSSGDLESIVCWVMDVSVRKEAELSLRRRMDEALEMKRQQENFIDMISHEIRNPLSAVLHCADEIIVSLGDYLKSLCHNTSNGSRKPGAGGPIPDGLGDVLSATVEAAHTISYCVQHQKHIVDDVLTLSKLDSDLLVITPTPSLPTVIIREALKMFDAEIKEAKIDLKFIADHSLQKLNVQWLLLDPSRVLQVFINLTTNAIKFTRKSAKRQIVVVMAASTQKPSEVSSDVEYFPQRSGKQCVIANHDWLPEETIYLSLSVSDTGCGLTPEEKSVLFNRFSQGSPKTHIKYGGSGLGLFISRQLVEMQGGEIGLVSKKGTGSTFTFFIKTLRTQQPKRTSIDFDVPIKVQLENLVGHADTTTVDEHEAKVEKAPTRRISVTKIELKILIVEDNLVNQKVLSKQLRRYKHIVEVANHGQEALDALRQTNSWDGPTAVERAFDIVLMDIEMPVMDGLTCIKKIRQLERTGTLSDHVPAIAVTANARNEHIQVALEAGFDDVTTKPYKIQDILTQMHRAYLSKQEQ